jgi:GTPase involved in cell partitioning and DNA repair
VTYKVPVGTEIF